MLKHLQGRICSDNCTCCHTETGVADQMSYLTQSTFTDTGPTSNNTDPITPGAWQGSHWSTNFEVIGVTPPGKRFKANAGIYPRCTAVEANAFTTRSTIGSADPGSLFAFHRLGGLVAKASSSGAEDPGFDSRLRRGEFCRVELYQ